MEILAIKVFVIVGSMLIVTAIFSRLNKAFETKWEFWGLFASSIVLLIFLQGFPFPFNFILALLFAVLMGLLIGPGIRGIMLSFVIRKRIQAQGYTKERLAAMSDEEKQSLVSQVEQEIESSNAHASLVADWNRIVALAIYSTAAITAAAAFIVFFFSYDFSFLGQFLLIALLGLIIVGILNILFFKSPLVRLIFAYVGAVVFSLYLLYDFDRLKDAAGDTSWETAISIGVSLYLDIINLFLDLLQILGDSN
jgi:FtsH-binding integral membrane protein